MIDSRFTFAVQRLPAGSSYAESFQDQASYEFPSLLFSHSSFQLEFVRILVLVVK